MNDCQRCGLAWFLFAATSGGAPPESPVIVEVHYDDVNPTMRSEFLEVHNPATNAVDLSSWQLTDAVTFAFPPGTILAGGGYLVVAEHPPTMLSAFGAAALGPWSGKLDNSGERIVLRDPDGRTVDEVEYGVGFPWPTAAEGGGASMELIHPSLDNNLGGSWRASGGGYSGPEVTLLAPLDTGWRYRKGLSQPVSDPGGRQWFEPGYDLSAGGGWPPAQTPIGYGDGDDTTVLADMQGTYISVFLRNEFVIAPGQPIPGSVLLRAYVDDGCIVYLNGKEAARFSISEGLIPFPPPDGFALDHEAAWEEHMLVGTAAGLQPGTNTIAVQVVNGTLGSSDLSFDLELKTGPPQTGIPTPGRRNSVFSTSVPPQVRQVEHSPVRPRSGEAVTVSAKITDPQGVSSVNFSYQVVAPGSYIRLTDPGYGTEWTDLPMYDDGTHGDPVADDFHFTTVVPTGVQVHRRLIRYRIRAADEGGAGVQVPYPDDPQPNFAYFCYDGVPAWQGADQPGTTPVQNFGRELLESLPVYHLVANATDVVNCQYNQGYRDSRFLGTLIYDGEVYDHIQFNIRGEYSTYRTNKNKWRFRFNRGHDFQARDNFGNKYARGWKDLKVNGGTAPWTYVNRGMAGVDECISFRLFELAGVPSSRTSYFHFRVIDGAAEANPSDQYDGDLWGLYYSVEVPDGRFLDDRGLPDGNLYKLENPVVQGNQGEDEPLGPSDVQTLRNAMTTAQTESWWGDHVDHRTYGRFKAVAEAITHYDQRDGLQGYYYHNPETAEWVLIPWDLDTMFQLTHKYYTWDRFRLCIDPGYPTNRLEAKNEQREILDLLFNELAVDTVLDELVNIVNPSGQALTWADLDQFMWNYHPRTPAFFKGSFNVLVGSSDPAGAWYTRTLVSADHEGQMEYLRSFLRPGGWGYDRLVAEVADAHIPDTPTVTYTGGSGYPVNDLRVASSAFSDPDGNGTFAAMSWRIGEIADPLAPNFDPDEFPPYEVRAVWHSDETAVFDSPLAIPSQAIAVGSTYRVRVRHKDTSGRWSHWSAPSTFTTSEPDNALALVHHLRITEIMYHPPHGDLEFMEVHNTSPDQALDLGGVAFTLGIEFAFPEGTLIPPGGVILVLNDAGMADPDAFRAYYGLDPSVVLAGPYAGRLNNQGEELRIKTSISGTEIVALRYDDSGVWPPRTGGGGSSLEIRDPLGPADDALNWRASHHLLGSPGWVPPATLETVRIIEVLAHTDWPLVDAVELYNPGAQPVDIGGWYLSDSTDYRKYRFPSNTVIAAGGYRVVDETQFNPNGEWNTDPGKGPVDPSRHFALSGAYGDEIHLAEAGATGEITGFADSARFGATANGESLGCWPDGAGGLYPMLHRSLGAANSPPRVGPVVLSEIMYHPADTNHPSALEFIEIVNPGPSNQDLGRGSLAGAVSFDFPVGTLLPAGGVLVVVGFDPVVDLADLAMFQAAYGPVVPLGPWSGQLDNVGEVIHLRRADSPPVEDPEYYPQLEEERVGYRAVAPWPTEADGTGMSLQRLNPYTFGDRAANWVARAPSPGQLPETLQQDAWNRAHFSAEELVDPSISGPDADPDGDGMPNVDEYAADTDPRSGASRLLLNIRPGTGNQPAISFRSSAERRYRIEKAGPSLGEGGWLTEMSEGPGTGGVMEWMPATDGDQEAYRLRAVIMGAGE